MKVACVQCHLQSLVGHLFPSGGAQPRYVREMPHNTAMIDPYSRLCSRAQRGCQVVDGPYSAVPFLRRKREVFVLFHADSFYLNQAQPLAPIRLGPRPCGLQKPHMKEVSARLYPSSRALHHSQEAAPRFLCLLLRLHTTAACVLHHICLPSRGYQRTAP